MDFPCSECHYCDKCFPLLKLLSRLCQQGRRKKSQTKISDFPKEEDGEKKGEYDTRISKV